MSFESGMPQMKMNSTMFKTNENESGMSGNRIYKKKGFGTVDNVGFETPLIGRKTRLIRWKPGKL